MSGVPIWLAALIAVGSPVLALAGLLLARRADREVETRWQREEAMRLLRWAADHVGAEEVRRRRLGTVVMRALGQSPLLQAADQRLVADVLRHTMTRGQQPGGARGGDHQDHR